MVTHLLPQPHEAGAVIICTLQIWKLKDREGGGSRRGGGGKFETSPPPPHPFPASWHQTWVGCPRDPTVPALWAPGSWAPGALGDR